jgi:hypothetical protein
LSETAIEDLPMRDLVKLFKKQVSLHGVAKFVPLLADSNLASGVESMNSHRQGSLTI